MVTIRLYYISDWNPVFVLEAYVVGCIGSAFIAEGSKWYEHERVSAAWVCILMEGELGLKIALCG